MWVSLWFNFALQFMAEHDPDYMAWFHSTPPPPAIAVRRAISVYQWLHKKTDMEFSKASEQIKHTTQAEAWRVFRHRNGQSLVRVMRILPGEAICEVPMCLTVEREPGYILRGPMKFQLKGGMWVH